jgi:hypothetical protein
LAYFFSTSSMNSDASTKTYDNVEQLYHDIVNKKVDRKEVFKTIPIELRFEYTNYLGRLRQRKYRENHKELANERSKRSQAKRKKEDPEKYKEKCKQYTKKYQQKIRQEFIDFVKKHTKRQQDSEEAGTPINFSIAKKLTSRKLIPNPFDGSGDSDENVDDENETDADVCDADDNAHDADDAEAMDTDVASGASTLTDVSPAESQESSQQD